MPRKGYGMKDGFQLMLRKEHSVRDGPKRELSVGGDPHFCERTQHLLCSPTCCLFCGALLCLNMS